MGFPLSAPLGKKPNQGLRGTGRVHQVDHKKSENDQLATCWLQVLKLWLTKELFNPVCDMVRDGSKR
jgi:hypothetical protein